MRCGRKKANLDRTVCIELLEKLAAEDDGEALAVAREIHALITVAGISWNDLLVPEGGGGNAAGDQAGRRIKSCSRGSTPCEHYVAGAAGSPSHHA